MYPKGISARDHALRKPLVKWQRSDLRTEVDARIIEVFIHYRITLLPNFSNWQKAVEQLAIALIEEFEFESWLSPSVIPLDWKLVVCLLRRFHAFKGDAEIVRQGKPIHKGREAILVHLYETAKKSRLTIGELSGLIQRGDIDKADVPEKTKDLINEIVQRIPEIANADLENWFKDARRKYRETPDIANQQFPHEYGFLKKNIEHCLLSLTEDNERRQVIARAVAARLAKQECGITPTEGRPTDPLKTAIANYEWAQGPKTYDIQSPFLPRRSEGERAITEEATKVLEQKWRLLASMKQSANSTARKN